MPPCLANARQAMIQLDRLMLAGEHPVALLGQISVPLRRLAAAARIVQQAQAAGSASTCGRRLNGPE